MEVSIQTDKKQKKSPIQSKAPEEVEEERRTEIDPLA